MLIICALTSQAADAQRIALDDSLSPRQDFVLELAWSPEQVDQALAAMFQSDDVELPPLRGRLSDVEVRLDVSEFVGERVRIFMSIPRNIVGDNGGASMEAEFRGRGDFDSGTIRPGQEALIFEGILEERIVGGIFDFHISLSTSGIDESFDFELEYEIEISN